MNISPTITAYDRLHAEKDVDTSKLLRTHPIGYSLSSGEEDYSTILLERAEYVIIDFVETYNILHVIVDVSTDSDIGSAILDYRVNILQKSEQPIYLTNTLRNHSVLTNPRNPKNGK